MPYAVVFFFIINDLQRRLFALIDGVVDHHYLNFLFIKSSKYEINNCL
jgi:hypothetical protein